MPDVWDQQECQTREQPKKKKKSSALFSKPGFINMHVREIFYEKDFFAGGLAVGRARQSAAAW